MTLLISLGVSGPFPDLGWAWLGLSCVLQPPEGVLGHVIMGMAEEQECEQVQLHRCFLSLCL